MRNCDHNRQLSPNITHQVDGLMAASSVHYVCLYLPGLLMLLEPASITSGVVVCSSGRGNNKAYDEEAMVQPVSQSSLRGNQ